MFSSFCKKVQKLSKISLVVKIRDSHKKYEKLQYDSQKLCNYDAMLK